MRKTISLLIMLCAFAITAGAQQRIPKNAIRQAYLSADSTNSTTGLKATPLSVTVDSNSVWAIEAYLLTGSTTAPGMAIAIDIPSGAAISAVALGTDSTISQFNSDAITIDSTAGHAWNNANAQTGWVRIAGVITVGATTGSVVIQHKKNTSGVATLRSKSYIKLTKIQ